MRLFWTIGRLVYFRIWRPIARRTSPNGHLPSQTRFGSGRLLSNSLTHPLQEVLSGLGRGLGRTG